MTDYPDGTRALLFFDDGTHELSTRRQGRWFGTSVMPVEAESRIDFILPLPHARQFGKLVEAAEFYAIHSDGKQACEKWEEDGYGNIARQALAAVGVGR